MVEPVDAMFRLPAPTLALISTRFTHRARTPFHSIFIAVFRKTLTMTNCVDAFYRT